MLGGSPIFEKTKKQVAVSCSSVEAEFHLTALAVSELVRIKLFLASLGVFHKKHIHLYYDLSLIHI